MKRLALYVIFFVSGFCGLCYEVIWGREFHLVLGNTTYAVSAVLAAFMAGLAAGSRIFGRVCDRSASPMALYAYLELGIGLFGLFFVYISKAYWNVFMAVSPFATTAGAEFALKFVSTLVMIIIPTTLMGATFPVMARVVMRDVVARGGQVGLIYFLNSVGGALGCLASGFFMIEEFGAEFSLDIVALLNIACGVAALAMARYSSPDVPAVPEESGAPETPDRAGECAPQNGRDLIFWLFFVSGFSSMVFEVAWTRLLVIIIGSSTYSFSLMLFTFILFLSAGSLLISRFIDGFSDPLAAFGGSLVFAGAYISLTMPYYDTIPSRLVDIYSTANLSYFIFILLNFAVCALVMAPPALAFGATFPAAVRAVSMGLSESGTAVGRLYSVNTVGCIAGSLSAGLFILPALGLRLTIAAGVVLVMIAGAAAIVSGTFSGARRPWRVALGFLAPALAVLTLASPDWDIRMLNIGGFYRKTGMSTETISREVENYRTLYYREGVSSTVYVFEDRTNGQVSLKINGKTDGSTSKYDMVTQRIMAVFPTLKAASPKKVLVIGLGTGNTLGALSRFRCFEKIVCVEICPEVVEAAKCFREAYDSYSRDPRVSIVVADARSYILGCGEKFDVIISEPSNPWIAGISSLYTTEFFTLCREHITPDGSMLAWIQAYESSEDVFKLMLRTFLSQFPESELWYNTSGDVYAVWSAKREDPVKSIPEYYKKIAEDPAIADIAARCGFTSEVSFAGLFFMTGGQLHRFVGDGVLNSDNFQTLEFEAPRLLYTAGRVRPDFRPYVENYLRYVKARSAGLGERRITDGIMNFIDFIGFKSRYPAVPLALLDHLISENPSNHRAHYLRSRICHSMGSFAEALDSIERAMALAPGEIDYVAARAEVAYGLSLSRVRTGSDRFPAMSVRDWRTACASAGAPNKWRAGLALALRETGDIAGMTQEALGFAGEEKDPEKAFNALYKFSAQAAEALDFERALLLVRKAAEIYPAGSREASVKIEEYLARTNKK